MLTNVKIGKTDDLRSILVRQKYTSSGYLRGIRETVEMLRREMGGEVKEGKGRGRAI